MWRSRSHAVLTATDAFTAATAIAGCALLATGREGDRFPTRWLTETPFRSHVLPGAIEALYAGVGLAMLALGVRVVRATAPVSAT